MKSKEYLSNSISSRLILKHDLGYTFNEEEQKLFSEMDPFEKEIVRGSILNSIKNEDLCIDVFEEYLNDLKAEEYNRYMLTEGAQLDVSEQMEKLAELEGKCTQMVINIAKNRVSREDLLGPTIHDTYGVSIKS